MLILSGSSTGGSLSLKLFDILEFGSESPLTMRALCSAFRYCPDPLGFVPVEVLDKLELAYSISVRMVNTSGRLKISFFKNNG